jgi:hypothetical protein
MNQSQDALSLGRQISLAKKFSKILIGQFWSNGLIYKARIAQFLPNTLIYIAVEGISTEALEGELVNFYFASLVEVFLFQILISWPLKVKTFLATFKQFPQQNSQRKIGRTSISKSKRMTTNIIEPFASTKPFNQLSNPTKMLEVL